MENNQPNEQYPNINLNVALISMLMDTKAYLRTIRDNQEKILAHLEKRDITNIMKETDDLFQKHREDIQKEVFEDYDTKKFE